VKYSVTKRFTFEYAHRLHNHPGKCKYLHGHSGVALVEMGSDTLNEQGMVADFGIIKKTIGMWINTRLDHTTFLHKEDPLVDLFMKAEEGFAVTEEPPTAEFLATMLWKVITTLMLEYDEFDDVFLKKVTVYETENNYATVS
jgi:6-pyruvoyltetrahydropterin/6-carboxytetrahydropterin synthase